MSLFSRQRGTIRSLGLLRDGPELPSFSKTRGLPQASALGALRALRALGSMHLASDGFSRAAFLIAETDFLIRSAHKALMSNLLDNEVEACRQAYDKTRRALHKTPGWMDLENDTRRTIGASLEGGWFERQDAPSIPFLRSEREACDTRLRKATERVFRTLEGERLPTIQVAPYFAGGVETEEQLDAAFDGIREQCLRLFAIGKKVVPS